MSCILVGDKPITLYLLIHTKEEVGISLTRELGVSLLLNIGNGLNYIHNRGFLHNDLKLDNVAIGTSIVSSRLKAFIIDFGKVCLTENGKMYKLSEEEKEHYKHEHPQVALDLRDGLVSQSNSTDIYSFGRILKRINNSVISSPGISQISKSAIAYHSHCRPATNDIISVLEKMTV